MYHGWVSAVHGEREAAQTVAAYERALAAMAAEGAFRGR